jgi:hypothetical protein
MREDDLYYFLLESSFGLSMAALWQHMRVQLSSSGYGFYEQSDMFFRLLAWLIEQGKIKLACDGEFLSGAKGDQVDLLKDAWPNNPGEDDLDGYGYWFLIEAPAGVVWIAEDGREIWA